MAQTTASPLQESNNNNNNNNNSNDELAKLCKGGEGTNTDCACASNGEICPRAALAAAAVAVKALAKLHRDSVLFAHDPEFVYYEPQNIEMGKKLGEGGFCVVRNVELNNHNNAAAAEELRKTGSDRETDSNMMVVKHLKRAVLMDRIKFQHGAADLAIEPYFLALLHDHPHILKLHGVSAGNIETVVAHSGRKLNKDQQIPSPGYFLVVERIFYNLTRKISLWKRAADELQGDLLARLKNEYKQRRRAALMERLQVAIQICDGMAHMHGRGVIYRDLKPDNIGFDAQGNVKIFDFGLAREMKEKYKNGTYKLTGNTGSRRYMSPEVAQGQHYGLSADVFSFGVMLYDIATMEDPIRSYTSRKRGTPLVIDGEPPQLDSACWFPMDLQILMKKCWSKNPADRPTFEGIKQTLEYMVDHSNSSRSARRSKASKSSKESRTPKTSFRRSTVWNAKPKKVPKSDDKAEASTGVQNKITFVPSLLTRYK